MSYPTGNELKKEIRASVPELGHRDLSVKYGGSYRVAVKKVVHLSKVKAVAEQYESYSRCEHSGEILSGGNTFVFVEFMSWDTNNDVPFEVPVPEVFETAVTEMVKSIQDGYTGIGSCEGKYRHMVRRLQEDNTELFADYTDSDVGAVLGLVSRANESVSGFIQNDTNI